MSLAASVDALIESALDSLRCGDTCPADSFCAAVDLVTASSPSDTGPLNSAGERLVECLLAVDRSARQDTALKLRVWRPLIVLLKRIHNDVSASTSTRLLGALISYVSGGVQSLMAMGGAEADDRGGPRGSLVDVLMFFLQRLGVALLYLHTDIAADQASEALGALAACRGALGQRDAAIVADQVLLRVLLSKTAVRNSEALREVFCVCSEEHAKNAGVDVSAAAYMCHATVGYLQFWIAVLAELAGDAAGEPGRTQLVPRGVGAALRCLQSLCLVHTGFVTDEFVVVSCFELGARLGAELQRGNIVAGARLMAACCEFSGVAVWALVVLRGTVTYSPSAATEMARLCAAALRNRSACPHGATRSLASIKHVIRICLRHSCAEASEVILEALVREFPTAELSVSYSLIEDVLLCIPLEHLVKLSPATLRLARSIKDLCCGSGAGAGKRGAAESGSGGSGGSALRELAAAARHTAVGCLTLAVTPAPLSSQVHSTLIAYISALESCYRGLSAINGCYLLPIMLSKRCALVSRLESVRPGARAGSEGLAEIGAAAGLFADAVDLCVMAAAAGTGGHSDRTEANALCLRSCTLTCSALRYSSITFSSLPAITPTDVSRFKVFVSLYLLFCACLDNSYSVMEQSLGVIYQAFGRAVALLGTTASTPRAPPALRSVSAQCWALYASNTVAFAGSVPAQLKDMMVASFLVREVISCVSAWSRREHGDLAVGLVRHRAALSLLPRGPS